MSGLQVDMRDFLNAPNGLPKQSAAANERLENDPSQSPLGGRTVWEIITDIVIHNQRTKKKKRQKKKRNQ